MRPGLLAALLALGAGPLHADAAPERDLAYERYVEAVLDAAETSRDPRVLVAAASFAADVPGRAAQPAVAARRDALGARGAASGGDDPVVWFVLAADCPLSPAACESARAVERLREVAPNNAVGWLLKTPGDDADASFARAVAANRYDTYEGEFVRALSEAAGAVPAPEHLVAEVRAAGVAAPESVAHVALALGVAIAKASPQLEHVFARCDDRHGLDGGAREACIALGRLMLNRSRDELAQRLGVRILARRLPDGQERADALAVQRRLDWWREKSLDVLAADAYPASLLNWLHAGADEHTVLRAMLSENGIPAEPPAGWRPRASSVLPDTPPAG